MLSVFPATLFLVLAYVTFVFAESREGMVRLAGRGLAAWSVLVAAAFPAAGLVVAWYHLCPLGRLLERLYEYL